ncbi:interleukin-9 [Ctenodactylus gundi]
MLLAGVLASALLVCSVLGQRCSTSSGIRDVSFLIKELQDNCTTSCFLEGLSRTISAMKNAKHSLIFFRVRKTVEVLKNNKCQFFSCEQQCNHTTAGNTVTFLSSLLETLQIGNVEGGRGPV